MKLAHFFLFLAGFGLGMLAAAELPTSRLLSSSISDFNLGMLSGLACVGLGATAYLIATYLSRRSRCAQRTRTAASSGLAMAEKLRRSPFALDVYVWLSYRLPALDAPLTIPWGILSVQFGGRITEGLTFQHAFKGALPLVLALYQSATLSSDASGLTLHPSPPPPPLPTLSTKGSGP